VEKLPEQMDEAEKQKRVRALTKRLRQITQLKEDQASGKQMNSDQLSKIDSEEQLLQELKEFEN